MKTRPEQLRAAIALATLCAAIGVATVPSAQAQQWSPRRPGHPPAQPDQRPRPNRHDIRTFWDEFEEAKAADATAPRVPRATPARASSANQSTVVVAHSPDGEERRAEPRRAAHSESDRSRPAVRRATHTAPQPKVGRLLPAAFTSGIQGVVVGDWPIATSEEWWFHNGLPANDGFAGTKNWVQGGGLLMWMNGFRTPVLVTTSPAGVAREFAGVLGQPGTQILAGGSEYLEEARGGGFVTLGHWFDANQQIGVSASFLGLAEETDVLRFTSNDFPVLARPYNELEPDFLGPTSELVAFPGQFTGEVDVTVRSQFSGVEVLLRRALFRVPSCRMTFLAGWRYLDLDEELQVRDVKRALAGSGLPEGTTLEELDAFRTRNYFNGVNLGVLAEARSGRLTTSATMKVALGRTSSRVAIDGEATATVPLPNGGVDVATTPAGLLAQETNIGDFEYDRFAVVPELGVEAAYDVTPCLQASVGYTFLYWSRVARPGDQIDTDLNLSQLAPGGLVGFPRPEQQNVDDDLWVQGLRFGLQYRF